MRVAARSGRWRARQSAALCLAIASLWLALIAVGRADPLARPPGAPSHSPSGGPSIYVVRRGWHVDVGFAVDELAPPLSFLAARLPGARYVFFGFGDRRYLVSKRRNGPVLLEALWPGKALILVTGLTASPAAALGAQHVVELTLTAAQSARAQDFVRQSLSRRSSSSAGEDTEEPRQAERPPLEYAPGPYEGSLFYLATARYSAFHTCNTWAAEVLAEASLPVHPRGMVFAGQVWRKVRRLMGPYRQGGFVPS